MKLIEIASLEDGLLDDIDRLNLTEDQIDILQRLFSAACDVAVKERKECEDDESSTKREYEHYHSGEISVYCEIDYFLNGLGGL